MELTALDRVRKAFMTKKGFVMYMLDKNARKIGNAVESSKSQLKDIEEAIGEAIAGKRRLEAKNIYVEQRLLEIQVKLEAQGVEYSRSQSKKRSDPDNEARLAGIIEELVDEEVRAEAELARNMDSIKDYTNRQRTIRRTYNEVKDKASALGAQYEDIKTRREMVRAMDKTQVALGMIELGSTKENSMMAEAILGATEKQQDTWREGRDLNSKGDTEHQRQVEQRLDAILHNGRKAIQ